MRLDGALGIAHALLHHALLLHHLLLPVAACLPEEQQVERNDQTAEGDTQQPDDAARSAVRRPCGSAQAQRVRLRRGGEGAR